MQDIISLSAKTFVTSYISVVINIFTKADNTTPNEFHQIVIHFTAKFDRLLYQITRLHFTPIF